MKLHQRWLFWQCTPRTSCGVCPGPAANLPPQCALASNPAWGPCTHTLVLDTVLNQPRSFFIGQCLEMQQCHHDLRCADVRAALPSSRTTMHRQWSRNHTRHHQSSRTAWRSSFRCSQVAELIKLQQKASDGVVLLDGPAFARLVGGRSRPYSVVVFSNAYHLLDRPQLRLRELRAEFGHLARSYRADAGTRGKVSIPPCPGSNWPGEPCPIGSASHASTLRLHSCCRRSC